MYTLSHYGEVEMTNRPPFFRIGERVTLSRKPSSMLSQYYSLTVGKAYEIMGMMGCLVVIATDVAGETASIHPLHFDRC